MCSNFLASTVDECDDHKLSPLLLIISRLRKTRLFDRQKFKTNRTKNSFIKGTQQYSSVKYAYVSGTVKLL